MKTSESIKNIAPALLRAQRKMESAKKSASNPYFKSKYADLNAVLAVAKEALNSENVFIAQPQVQIDGQEYIQTVLMHESGEFVSSDTKIEVAKASDPQALGSGTSYARRYGLQALVALESADDDCESIMQRNKPASTQNSKQEVHPELVVPSDSAVKVTTTSSFRKPAAKKVESATPLMNGNGHALEATTENWE